MTLFLAFLFEMLESATPTQVGDTAGDWFGQACRMLTNDLHHKVKYRQVADALGMSYHTFRAYFTKRAGIPPAQYRDAQRLKAAKDLLINNPHKSCKQIAFTLGYYNGDHFSAQFKKQVGVSPNQYRKKRIDDRN
jgi:AraC-like DNA-binding protein